MNKEFKKMMKKLVEMKDIELWHWYLTALGFKAVDLNTYYENSVGICYSFDGNYSAEMRLFPVDECLGDQEADDEENAGYLHYLDVCDYLIWPEIKRLTLKGYVYVSDSEGKEYLGMKDFGISLEEYDNLEYR